MLVLFDLDHTLLDGDSDELWCEFLMRRGVLDRATFEARNRDMVDRYRSGRVGAQEFSEFYVATLRGRSADEWAPLRADYLAGEIVPRIGGPARALVERHRAAGDLLVLTTATNRYLAELTAAHLGLQHLIATDCEVGTDGRFAGRTMGTLNMREGKVACLHAWLAGQGLRLADLASRAYSDSINDRPLLEAVNEPVAVNPDERLAALAAERGWPVLNWKAAP